MVKHCLHFYFVDLQQNEIGKSLDRFRHFSVLWSSTLHRPAATDAGGDGTQID